MLLKERLEQIEKLQNIETPWKVKRLFGQLCLHGDNICISNNSDSDFVTLAEFQEALQWLVQQAGGTCQFKRSRK